MIFVRDKGRMCNNLLQYGHVYAWGREHGRVAMSMRFAYKFQYFHICTTRYHHFFYYVIVKYMAKWGLIPIVSFSVPEVNTQAREETMIQNKYVMVEGWYVRFYDLFLKYKKEIIQLFAFKPKIKAKIQSYIKNTATKDSVKLGLHIRRGDYRTWMGGKYYYDDVVYLNYIRQFKDKFAPQSLTVYICGNDSSLDKSFFEKELMDVKVIFPQGNPGEDLCLLSECDYLIGAPSTFSLVAAMYKDVPLYWVEDAHAELTKESFKHFDYLLRHIK